MQPDLNFVISLARQAGEILRAAYGRRPQIWHKGVIDLVTDADQRSEAFLVSEIQRHFPDHRIITEESGTHAGQDCCQWYLDPLDGTINFAHGVPVFCVSVAYQQDGQVQLGVVYDPLREECFSAAQGQGAWLNGERLRPSGASELDECLLTTGFPYDVRTREHNNLDWYAYFALHSQGVRRLGSAALDLCYVAAGRYDGYWELAVQPWDIAAGMLIGREAGARVTNLEGEADMLQPPCSALAATPLIYQQMLAVFKPA